jgi:hypothetical protein
VNPAHLFLGTQADNVADMKSKGRARSAAGVRNPQAKLNDDLARAIRTDKRGMTTVAKAYGVSETLIRKIRIGEAWAHVDRAGRILDRESGQ